MSSRVLNSNEEVMIRLGLIGCGSLGRVHAGCISTIPDAGFVAYADVRADAASRLCEEFGGEWLTTEPEKIFADESIDAVYICTHHDSHARLAVSAARAGKHILIEKPLALTVEECETVAQEVQRAGVHLMPAFKMRYYPLVQRAHEFIPKPDVVVAQMMDTRWPDEHWAQDPVEGGANVHSQGCHTTDLLRYFVGSEPSQLWASGGTVTHPGHPCIDQCVASIRFVSGTVASWIQGDAGMPPFVSKFFFQLWGGNRTVQLHDRLKKATFSDGATTWEEERPEEEGFQRENEAFVRALREGTEPDLTAHDGIQATRIVLGADHSIRTGEVRSL